MGARYNCIASNERLRDLKKKLKLNGLEKMMEESKKGLMHTFNSCKFLYRIFICLIFQQTSEMQQRNLQTESNINFVNIKLLFRNCGDAILCI